MVKKIKKRIPKPEADTGLSPEDEAALAAGEAEDGVIVSTGAPVVPEGDEAPEEGPAGPVDFGEVAEDEFGRATARGIQWIVEHSTLMIGAAVVGVVAAGAIWYSQRSDLEARAAVSSTFYSATDSFSEAAAPAEEGKKVDRAALLQSAKTGFEQLKTEGQGTGLATLAELGLAGTALQQDKPADAIKGYEQVITGADDPVIKAVSIHGQAVAHEDAGNMDEAIKSWEALVALDGDTFGLMGGLQIGRLMEKAGKGAEAKAYYEKLQKDHAEALDSPMSRQTKAELERRLARLGA